MKDVGSALKVSSAMPALPTKEEDCRVWSVGASGLHRIVDILLWDKSKLMMSRPSGMTTGVLSLVGRCRIRDNVPMIERWETIRLSAFLKALLGLQIYI